MKHKRQMVLVMTALTALTCFACRSTRVSPYTGETLAEESGFIEQSPEEDPNGIYDTLEDLGPSHDKIRIGFSAGGLDSEFLLDVAESLRACFHNGNGYEMVILDAHMEQDQQIKDIRRLIEAAVDYLIILPLPDCDWTVPLAQAGEADIPVLFIGDVPDGIDEEDYLSTVTGDAQSESQLAVSWLHSHVKTDDMVRIACVNMDEMAPGGKQRIDAFMETAQKESSWQTEYLLLDGKTDSEIKAALDEWLEDDGMDSKHVIVCANGTTGEYITDALENLDYDGTAPLILTFESTRTMLERIRQDRLSAAVESCTDYGNTVDEIIQSHSYGMALQKNYLLTPERVYDETGDLERILEERVYTNP